MIGDRKETSKPFEIQDRSLTVKEMSQSQGRSKVLITCQIRLQAVKNWEVDVTNGTNLGGGGEVEIQIDFRKRALDVILVGGTT